MALARGLGLLGLTGDLRRLVRAQPAGLGEARAALEPEALERVMQAATTPRLLASRLRPVVLLAADAGCAAVEEVLGAVRADLPWRAPVLAWLRCIWLARLEREAEAIAAFEATPDEMQPEEMALAAYCDALCRLGRRAEAEARLIDHETRFGLEDLAPRSLILLADAHGQLSETARSAEILALVEARTRHEVSGPAARSRQNATLRLAGLQAMTGAAALALETIEAQLRATPGVLDLEVERLGHLAAAQGIEACLAAALPLVAAHPQAMTLLMTLRSLPLGARRLGLLCDTLPEGALAAMPAPVATVWMRNLLASGRMAAAREVALRLQASSALARVLVRGGLRASGRVGFELPETGFVELAGTGTERVVLVFPGGNGLEAFGLPIALLDSHFEARGVSAVYCRDETGLLGFFGKPGHGGSAAELAEVLAGLPLVAGAREVAVLGISSGGLMALNFGARIGALTGKRLRGLAYSPKTIIGRPAPDVVDRVVERHMPRFARLDPAELDVAAIWQRFGGLSCAIHYGAGMATDRAHALRLGGFPGVELIGLPGLEEHDSFTPALESGAFEAALDRLLGLGA